MCAVNAASANLGGEYFLRSHFVSRGWASLGLAMMLARLTEVRRGGIVSVILFATFVFLGIWGGVERQSYLLGYALNERRELLSLLEAVPGFEAPARLVLIQPPGAPSVIASNNANTIPFLYNDLSLWHYRVMAPNSAFDYSRIDGDSAGRIRVLVNSKDETFVDPATCILVFYSISQRRFIRLDQVPAGLLRGSASFFNTYQPKRWLRPQTDRPPKAISEFASYSGFALAERAMRRSRHYARAVTRSPSATMFSVSPSLAKHVDVDSLAPYVVESQGAEGIVWLGSGRAEGYSSMLWARDALSGTLRIHIAPGPSRRQPERHLVTRLTQADGRERAVKRHFAEETTLDVQIDLAAGANLLEMWVEDQADVFFAADSRNLLASLKQMRLGKE
jgi:hypothetical protein